MVKVSLCYSCLLPHRFSSASQSLPYSVPVAEHDSCAYERSRGSIWAVTRSFSVPVAEHDSVHISDHVGVSRLRLTALPGSGDIGARSTSPRPSQTGLARRTQIITGAVALAAIMLRRALLPGPCGGPPGGRSGAERATECHRAVTVVRTVTVLQALPALAE